ncbi:MAG: LexA family transcriptional regulator [Thermotogota bacterium]|nr:LexA family transcriptional regulator [Thermotogota bacterium]
MSIQNLLKELREKRGINQNELAKMLGLNMSTISAYERGIRKPSKKVLIKLSNLFEISLEYLLRVSEELDPTQTTERENEEIFQIRNYLKRKGIDAENAFEYLQEQIPLLGLTGAGANILAQEKAEDYTYGINADFAVSVHGDSMEPLIKNGSIALIKRINIEQFRNLDIALVIVNNDQALLKRLYLTKNGVWLLSDNNAYDPIFFKPEDWERECLFLGKAVEIRFTL